MFLLGTELKVLVLDKTRGIFSVMSCSTLYSFLYVEGQHCVVCVVAGSC